MKTPFQLPRQSAKRSAKVKCLLQAAATTRVPTAAAGKQRFLKFICDRAETTVLYSHVFIGLNSRLMDWTASVGGRMTDVSAAIKLET